MHACAAFTWLNAMFPCLSLPKLKIIFISIICPYFYRAGVYKVFLDLELDIAVETFLKIVPTRNSCGNQSRFGLVFHISGSSRLHFFEFSTTL